MSSPQHPTKASLLERLPRTMAFPVLCAVLMTAPTMTAGLFMDDALTRAKLLGLESPWSPAPWWDLYTFGREDLNAGLLAAGHHPWWADPEMKMTFFRPLSALTHHLDYFLWPHSPALQHLHSVLWYGLTVVVAAVLFRRLHEGAQGRGVQPVVAALAFAVATPHIMTVGWLAGRNTLIAFVFGGVLIGAHLAWRQRGESRFALGAVFALIVGLLAGEAALGALGYVAAWHVCIDRALWKERLGALLPYGVVVAIWRWLYVRAGFGARWTSIYHDPSTDLLDFVRAEAMHLPVLLLGRWSPAPLDFWSVVPPTAHITIVGVAVVLITALAAAMWPLLRDEPMARFWALGMVLSLLPFCATVPMDRLAFFGGLGSAGLLGLVAAKQPVGLGAWSKRVRVALLVFYLPVSALFGLGRAATLGMNFRPNTVGYEQDPSDARVPQQTFVYVSGTFHRLHYTTLMRQADGLAAVPRRAVILTSMMTPSKITRVDEDTLEIVPQGGFMALGLDRIHRRVERAFVSGQTVELPDLSVEILDVTPDGRPARAAFHFKVPLEDPGLRWLAVVPGPGLFNFETRPFALPAPGQSVSLDGGL